MTMPTPDDLSSQIARAKGWTWEWCHFDAEEDHAIWVNPLGYAAERPDWTGTLTGCAELLRELNENTEDIWTWRWSKRYQEWWCTWAWQRPLAYRSPDDRSGDCIGEAWLNVHGKEAADASIE